MMRNILEVIVRTEDGRASIDIGLDQLSELERKFLFVTIAGATAKGGSVNFSLEPGPTPDERVLRLSMKRNPKSIKRSVSKAVQAANGSH